MIKKLKREGGMSHIAHKDIITDSCDCWSYAKEYKGHHENLGRGFGHIHEEI